MEPRRTILGVEGRGEHELVFMRNKSRLPSDLDEYFVIRRSFVKCYLFLSRLAIDV